MAGESSIRAGNTSIYEVYHKIKITFTIIDGVYGNSYNIYKLQGIPKTENQSEPETETKNRQPDQDTSKAIY